MRKETVQNGESLVLHFNSPAEVADCYAGVQEHLRSWTGGVALDVVMDRARHGHDALVPKAQAVIDKLNASGILLSTPQWADDVAGAFPNVPAFLAGMPQSMRARRDMDTDRAPVRLFVDLTTSAGIKADVIAQRGTCALALAMALSMQRPVEVYAVAAMDWRKGRGCWTCVRIQSNPLDLATACNALTSGGFVRTLCYDRIREQGSSGTWAYGDPFSNRAGYEAAARECLGLSDVDVYLPPVYLEDAAMLSDPVQWVNDQLAAVKAAAARA